MSECMRKLRREEQQAAQALWLDAFPEDADGFCAFYFAHEYPQDTYYGLFDNGRLCSMIGVAQVQIYLNGQTVPMPLLRGVATYAHLQGRGYAGRLLAYVLRELRSQGYGAAMLKTFIHGFYEKHGFAVCSYRTRRTLQAAAGNGEIAIYRNMCEIDDRLTDGLLATYTAYCRDKQLFLQRERRHIRRALTMALDVYGGVLAVYMKDGVPDGYLIGYMDSDGTLQSDEAVPGSGGESVFAEIAAKLGCDRVAYKAFGSGGEADAMIRVLDVQRWFRYRPQDSTFAFAVQDPLFPENCGDWQFGQPDNKQITILTPGQAAALTVDADKAGIYEEY